jgi:hypothetical protein
MSLTTLTRQYTTLLTATNDNMYPEIVDQVHNQVPYLWFMANRARPGGGIVFESGGTQLKFPIVQARNTNSKAYYGYDTLNPTPQDELTSGFEPWRSNAQMVAISMDEILENMGPEGIIKILPAKYQVALMSMYQDVHRQLVQGLVGTTGAAPADRFEPGPKELLPLGFLVQKYAAGSAYANSDLVHSLNQVTETYWKNQCLISAATSFAAFRRESRQIVHSCSFGSTTDSPDLGLCTQAYYELLEASSDTNMRRYVDKDAVDVGFEHVKLGQTTYIMDTVLPDFGDTGTDDVTLTAATTRAACVYLNTNWIQLVVHEMAYFTPTPWVEAINQTAIFSKLILKGSHRTTQRRKLGLHLGVDGTIAA